MTTRLYSALLTMFILAGCNTAVRDEVVEFDATGTVQSRAQLAAREVDAYSAGDYDTMTGVIGPGGVLVVVLVDQASGGWLSSHIGAPTRDGPSYRYTVESLSGRRIQVISRFPGFDPGDCVFVRKVDGAWRMGRAYTCTEPG